MPRQRTKAYAAKGITTAIWAKHLASLRFKTNSKYLVISIFLGQKCPNFHLKRKGL